MRRDSVIQLIAALCLVACLGGSSWMMPRLNALASEGQLRYTDLAVEGAPTPVVIAQSIGVLRGLMVNYLWIRADKLKEEGKFYEASHTATWITQLQPRFAAVWAFQAWNMAYNISVTTKTKEERWSWVNNGISLLRDQGIRYNPDNMALYRELAWEFFHKVGGITDDAHLYYKQQLADQWQGILGEPPYDADARVAAIEAIAKAPGRLSDLVALHPEVTSIIADLNNAHAANMPGLELDERLLRGLEMLRNLETGYLAKRLGLTDKFANLKAVDELSELVRDTVGTALLLRPIHNNPEYANAWPDLIAFTRKKVLLDEYNMDPAYMAQFMRDYGPLDWRMPASHTAYWAAIGVERGLTRFNQDGYDQINTDRLLFFTAQDNRRQGLLTYDFVSKELSFGPDLRYVDYYLKTGEIVISRRPFQDRPGSIQNYIEGTRNFLIDAVREAYQYGETDLAEKWYALLRDPQYAELGREDRFIKPIQQFIEDENSDRYTNHQVARGDIMGLMYQAFIKGLAAGNSKRYESCMNSARMIFNYYQREIGSVKTLITEQDRMAFDWDRMFIEAFLQAMVAGTGTAAERIALWERAPDELKVQVYDLISDDLRAMHDVFGASEPFESLFPAPAGLEAWRAAHSVAPESEKSEIQFERK